MRFVWWDRRNDMATNIFLQEGSKIPRGFVVAHKEKRWIRFGKWFPQQKEWYYSGTNERQQWSMAKGDEPTHWMLTPSIKDLE